jgi:hypothetical protein
MRFLIQKYDHTLRRSRDLGFVQADSSRDALLIAWRKWQYRMPATGLLAIDCQYHYTARALNDDGSLPGEVRKAG